MCIQDVRIGQAKVPRGDANAVVSGSATVPTLAPNARRAVAVITLSGDSAVDPTCAIAIRSGNPLGPVVGILTHQTPSWVGRVEVFGLAILGSLWTDRRFGQNTDVFATELEWLGDIEKL